MHLLCDNSKNCIRVFRLSDGVLLKSINEVPFKAPSSVVVQDANHIIVSDRKCIQVISCEQSIRTEKTMDCLADDMVLLGDRLIVSNEQQHTIQELDLNGKVVKSFVSEGNENTRLMEPRGLFVNTLNGQLLVCDQGREDVFILQ